MEYAAGAAMGYLVGSFNPSFFIGKIKGFDIRKSGSGNAGASNAIITMGKLVGVFCIFFDIFKAFFIIKLCTFLFREQTLMLCVTGTATILGHIFPFYMHFKGGKGLACLGGTILAYSPLIFLILLVIELMIVFISDYIFFVPITASIAFAVIYTIKEQSIVGGLIILIAAAVIFQKHLINIKRLKMGTELRFSYLWKGEKEKDRVRHNTIHGKNHKGEN